MPKYPKYNIHKIFFFILAQQPHFGLGRLFVEVSRSHSDAPHSVGLLWMRNRPFAENSARQHTTLTTDRHPSLSAIRNRNPSKRAATDPRLRPRGVIRRHAHPAVPRGKIYLNVRESDERLSF
jgi:hypothetical protein